MSKSTFKRGMREARQARSASAQAPQPHLLPPFAEPPAAYTPPTDEQLVDFAAAVMLGPVCPAPVRRAIEIAFARSAVLRDKWLERHRAFQSAFDSD